MSPLATLFRAILHGLQATIAKIAAKNRQSVPLLLRVSNHLHRTIQRFERLFTLWQRDALPAPRPGAASPRAPRKTPTAPSPRHRHRHHPLAPPQPEISKTRLTPNAFSCPYCYDIVSIDQTPPAPRDPCIACLMIFGGITKDHQARIIVPRRSTMRWIGGAHAKPQFSCPGGKGVSLRRWPPCPVRVAL